MDQFVVEKIGPILTLLVLLNLKIVDYHLTIFITQLLPFFQVQKS
jgi:hypothetical protein